MWLVGCKQAPCCLHSDPIERGHNAPGDVRGRLHLRTARRDGEKREEAGTMEGQNEKKVKTPEKCKGVGPAELETWQTETDTHTPFCAFGKCQLSLSPLLLLCSM